MFIRTIIFSTIALAALAQEKEVNAVAAQIRAEAAAARGEMSAHAKIVATEVIRARGKRFEMGAQRLDALRDRHLARAKHQTAIGNTPTSKK